MGYALRANPSYEALPGGEGIITEVGDAAL